MERKSSSKQLTKTASKEKGAAGAAPAADAAAPLAKTASLARSKSKSKESIPPAPAAAEPAPLVKAPSLKKAKSGSKELPAAKKKRGAAQGLDGTYWTTGKKTNLPAPVVVTPSKKKTYKRAAPVAGGLRKNKPTYGKMVELALKKLAGDEPRKGHSVIEVRKWIESRYPVPDNATRQVRLALVRAVNNKRVVRHGMRYRLTTKALSAKKRSKRTKSTKAAKVVAKKTGAAKPAKAVKGSKKSAAVAAAPALAKKASSKIPALGAGRPAPVAVGAAYAAFKKNFIWQYKDNGGKWANYDPAASDVVEGCYEEYQANPHMMDVRAVHSGEWQYQVDFIQMKQTNIQHEAHRVRDIRRVDNPAAAGKAK